MRPPKVVLALFLTGLVTVITVFFRIPIPASGGYLNIGDIVVIFAGLYLGRGSGFFVGGVGSAIADLIGYPVFAPFTFVIKGLEGALAGAFRGRFRYLGAFLGVVVMITGYFLVEAFFFPADIGMAGAMAELPFNLIQGAVGLVGGIVLHITIRRWTREEAASSSKQRTTDE